MSLQSTEVQTTGSVPLGLGRAETRGPVEGLAVAVSQLGSPPCLALGVMQLAAALDGTGRAFGFAALHALLVVLVPCAYLFSLLRAGTVSDLDVFNREERWRPFLATVLGAWLAWLFMRVTGAPVGPAPFVIVVPAMIWSRLLLRRHTPAQTLAGSGVGVLLVLLFFDLFVGSR